MVGSSSELLSLERKARLPIWSCNGNGQQGKKRNIMAFADGTVGICIGLWAATHFVRHTANWRICVFSLGDTALATRSMMILHVTRHW